LTREKSVVLFRSTIESIPFLAAFHATFTVSHGFPFFIPNAFALVTMENANAIFIVLHRTPNVKNDVLKPAALILVLGGIKVGTVIRANANINKRLSHFKKAMGNRRN
jgi:hypothetical protein